MPSKSQLSNLFKISRPRFYSYLFGPFVVGAAAAIDNLPALNTPLFYLLLFYFIFPANLFLYGINDIFDRDTDQLNQKKGSKEHLLKQKELSLLQNLVISIFIGTLVLAYFLPPSSALLLILFLLLSTFYSAKPIRFKARPFLDSYSNILYVIPGFLAYSFFSGSLPSFWAIITAWSWTIAMHSFSAIPDIQPDSKAGITTTAVLLGKQKALIFVGIHWLIFSVLTTMLLGSVGVLTFVYPFICLALLWKKSLSIEKVYWLFPAINTLFGFLAFWYFLLPVLSL